MNKKHEKFEEEMAKQIGSAGSTEENTGLGKLEHAEQIITGREALSDGEKDSMEAFQNRIKQDRMMRAEAHAVEISDGWVPVDRTELGGRSIFYPESWDFYVKPATVAAIKNWTAIDEEDPRQTLNVLNEILRTSVKIDTHSAVPAGWKQINTWDRFWFILKVREVTFTKGESKVEFEDVCSECDANLTYTLNANSLFFDMPDEELIDKYWNGLEWEIDPSEYGVNHDPIKLYTPKVGKDDAIIEWATAKVRAKQKVDETFVKFLVWLMPKPAKEDALNNQIERIYREYKSWDVDMFDFMDSVIRNLSVNPSETLRATCPVCGQEAHSNVKFPNGVKSLFRTETKIKKFGSR